MAGQGGKKDWLSLNFDLSNVRARYVAGSPRFGWLASLTGISCGRSEALAAARQPNPHTPAFSRQKVRLCALGNIERHSGLQGVVWVYFAERVGVHVNPRLIVRRIGFAFGVYQGLVFFGIEDRLIADVFTRNLTRQNWPCALSPKYWLPTRLTPHLTPVTVN
jgi:hypothetical protein